MFPTIKATLRPPWLCLQASLAVLCVATNAQTLRTESAWDRQLPFLALKEVDSQGASATEAWQAFSSAYGVRSVLFIEESELTEKPFAFQREECLVLDWFDAFAAAYELRWQADPATGVHWLFPMGMAYEDLLSVRIDIEEDYYGLPSITGVMAGFVALPELRPIYLNPGGWGFERSMNYPMDIPRGSHTLREIVNLACIANPILTFAALRTPRYTNLLCANVLLDFKNRPNPGLLLFWETEIGELDGREPSDEEILTKLADSSPRIRWAARLYLAIISPSVGTTKWLRDRGVDEEKSVWLSLAFLSIYVRDEQVPHDQFSAPLLRVATGEFFETARPDLAMLAALEVARLTGDTTGVETVLRRELPDKLLEDLTAEVARIARASDTVWQLMNKTQGGLAEISPQWTREVTRGATTREQNLKFSIASTSRE